MRAKSISARGGKKGKTRHARSSVDADDVRHGLRVSEAVGLRRDDLNLHQARLWFGASKMACRSSIRSPATSCEPSSAISPPAPIGCRCVDFRARAAAGTHQSCSISYARRRRAPACAAHIRTPCAIPAATILQTRAQICAPCRIISGIGTRATPSTTRALPAGDLRACGSNPISAAPRGAGAPDARPKPCRPRLFMARSRIKGGGASNVQPKLRSGHWSESPGAVGTPGTSPNLMEFLRPQADTSPAELGQGALWLLAGSTKWIPLAGRG